MPAAKQQPRAGAPRGLTFDLGAKPLGLFVPGGELREKCWDPFAPVWGSVVKCGISSQFDEVTYAQMLDDLVARDLRVYMDQDHRTASAGWSMDHVDIPALAFYCGVVVTHGGQVWRQVDLMGHSCAAEVPFDAAAAPEGLHAFRCQVTPLGRQVLENYQALSIHFDPYGEDLQGHPTGQVLICVSAVNGPHIAGARPTGGQFSNTRYFDMKTKRKLFALAKDEGGAEGEAPETKDLTVEMEELRKLVKMPEGASPEAIVGGAIAAMAAGGAHAEPDGDEPPAMAEEVAPDAMKYMDGQDEKMKGFARAGALRFSSSRRALNALAKEFAISKTDPVSVLKGVVAFKARSADAGELSTAPGRLKSLEDERAAEKAAAREAKIEALFAAVGSDGAGLLSATKIDELRAQAKKYNASPEDVATWLPKAEDIVFTQGGAPKGKGPAAPPAKFLVQPSSRWRRPRCCCWRRWCATRRASTRRCWPTRGRPGLCACASMARYTTWPTS